MKRSDKDSCLDLIFLRPIFRKDRIVKSFEDIDSNLVDAFLVIVGIMLWLNAILISCMIYDLMKKINLW